MADRAAVQTLTERFPPARTVLAGLLLAMAAGQVSDVPGFARILGDYRFFPGAEPTAAAWGFVAAETLAGIGLLRGRRWAATVALTVAIAWTTLAVQAFARGLAIANCGCFGVHLGQPLRWWVLLQDAYFVGFAAWVRHSERRRQQRPGPAPSSPPAAPVAGVGPGSS